jgi:hypothetical protein
VRARCWLGGVASLFVFLACSLTTDLDGLSSGGSPDGGGRTDGAPKAAGDSGDTLPDGGKPPIGSEAGVEAGAPTYGDIVMLDHPIAYFPFDEPADKTLITEKISGKNAVANRTDFMPGAPGIAGTAIAVTGHGDLDFGDTLDFVGNHAWTIEAWLKPALEDGKVFYEYFNKRENGNNGIVAYVRNENNETTVQLEQNFPGGGGRGVNAAVRLDRFQHVVFVYDPGKSGIRVWVDGSRSNAGYDDSGGPTDNSQPVYIASGIKGAVDEMAVYDYPLPDERILAHLAAGKRP